MKPLLLITVLLLASCSKQPDGNDLIVFENAVTGTYTKALVEEPTFSANIIRRDVAISSEPTDRWLFEASNIIPANVTKGTIGIEQQQYNGTNHSWFVGYSTDGVSSTTNGAIQYDISGLQTDIKATTHISAGSISNRQSVALNYTHMLSKLSFSFVRGTSLLGITVTDLEIVGIHYIANLIFDPSPKLTFDADKETNFKIIENKNYSILESITTPTAAKEVAYVESGISTLTFNITILSSNKVCTVRFGNNLESGKHYHITFTINAKNPITPSELEANILEMHESNILLTQ